MATDAAEGVRDRTRTKERDTGRDRTRKVRRPPGSSTSSSSLDSGKKVLHSRDEEKATVARERDPDLELDSTALRRIRIERLDGRHRHLSSSTLQSPGRERVFAETQTLNEDNMATESHATLRSERRDGATEGHRRRGHRDEEKKSRRKKKDGEGEEAQYVYGAPASVEKVKAPTVRVSETRRLGWDGEESEEEEKVSRSRTVREKPKERKIKVIYVTRDEVKTSKHKEQRVKIVRDDRPKDSGASVHRSREHGSRRKSVAEAPSLPPSPPRRYVLCKLWAG